MVSTRRSSALTTVRKGRPRRNPPPPATVSKGRPRRNSPPSAAAEADNGAGDPTSGGGDTKPLMDYEKYRDERIKENWERMQKLGIFDLSLSLQSLSSSAAAAAARGRRNPCSSSPGKGSSAAYKPSGPARRSSRLMNKAPVNMSEIDPEVEERRGRGSCVLVEGERDEVYTDEHVKLLGSSVSPWTLFVDGYGKDGKKIYDQIKGKSCHQCRQKTRGHRTCCSKCNLVQGQFCGDCLYMRYGENVVEANANPGWVCPVCRGICNCSLCRIKKGWAPTGILYRRISSQGFKSVAHYLIQTRQAHSNSRGPDFPDLVTSMEPESISLGDDAGEAIQSGLQNA